MDGQALTPEQAGRVYDRIGRLQDWQRFYEGPAIDDLIGHGDFEHVGAVYELGCGTGALAKDLFERYLGADAVYQGVDVSDRMIGLASGRLQPFGGRATVTKVDGHPPLPGEADAYDRFVSVYVFDLLGEELARDLLVEARRLLATDGRVCLVSLTRGVTRVSRVIGSTWSRVWEAAPRLVGGCRPIDLLPMLDGWRIDHTADIVAWGITSQVVVASPL
jgi:SAM-dependent methyltransferase